MRRKNVFHSWSVDCWVQISKALLPRGLKKIRSMNNQGNPLNALLGNLVLIGMYFLGGCIALSGIPDLNSQDGRVYAKRCAKCHGVPDPRFRTFREWEPIVSDMTHKIREKGLPPLSMDEREAILRYLERHAKPEKVTKI